jgi:predicted metal-dependent phosphoesterase TrpH
MLIDMHVHTDRKSLCSIIDPVELVCRAEELDLSGIVITEHDYVWTPAEIEALKRETKTDLLILRGQEVSSVEGHLLVYGYYETMDCISVEEIMHGVHQQGGVVLVSHPFRYGDRDGLSIEQVEAEFSRFDGIETLNGNQSSQQNEYGMQVWKSLGITGIGGSDAHSMNMVGRYVTEFENEISDESDLIRELKAGRCRPVLTSGHAENFV